MMNNIELCFEMKSTDMSCDEIKFLKDLYCLMEKYNVHRIYSASLDKKKIISAQQLLGITIGNTKFSRKAFNTIDKHIPWVYFNIFYKNHLFRYNISLKRLFKKYKVEKIGISSFNLYQGIHTVSDSLCIREVDLSYKDGRIFHIENLYLEI